MNIPASQFSGTTKFRRVTQHGRLTGHEVAAVSLSPAQPGVDAHDPSRIADIKLTDQAWIPHAVPGQAGDMITPLAAHLGGAPWECFGDWTRPASRRATTHAWPAPPQGLGHDIVVTSWE